MPSAELISQAQLKALEGAVLLDCRYSLSDTGQGRREYLEGHIPGAQFLDLLEDMSGPPARHGGRHPLPEPAAFARALARCGVGPQSVVVAYDDHRLAYAARAWWMIRSLGYRPPALLDGGYRGWLDAGGVAQQGPSPASGVEPVAVTHYRGVCDINQLREVQAAGAVLVDSREERRFRGLEEPIDPVAGHIPGAVNRPWQGVTTDDGRVHDLAHQRAHWGDLAEEKQLLVYCGSGVTACVNLFSLALLGRDDAQLYAGSWSDWCSYL